MTNDAFSWRRRPGCSFLSGVAVAIAAFTPTAWSQGVLNAPASKPANALSTAVQNIGLPCAEGLERLSRLAINGTRNHDILLDWDRKSPKNGPVFAMVGTEYANGSAVMSISAVPNGPRQCSLVAERISTAPYACQGVAQQELSGLRPVQLLPSMTVYADPRDATATVSLIDTPPGCLVIRRYVEFNWQPPAP